MTKKIVQKNLSGDRRFLERPRIDRLLEKALRCHVVTVVAGEGNGKTYAVNSFLQRNLRKTIWVQISERDNLGWRFWENYTGELAHLNPEAARIIADLGFPESGRQFDRYMSYIKNEIITRERYVLVFDDFHLITNPAILRFVEQALSAPISKNAIVLISRTEPAINTVSFLSKGLLAQITAADLRFTREETHEYFRIHRIFLTEEELDRICHDTEGWALAVGLVLQEIKRDHTGWKSRGWDWVMLPVKKIEENIFETMEIELRRFLIKLSFIEHWPRNLLEQLEGGRRNIAAMEKFSSIIRFDTYLHGFRIHNLFLDFLREKQGELSREEIREVCGKGALWCIENNLPTDAAIDYERAGDYGGIAGLIESLPRNLPRAAASFLLETVERMIAAVGDAGEEAEDGDVLFLRFIIRARLLLYLNRFEESAALCREAMTRFEAGESGPLRSRILSAAYNNLGTLGIRSCRYTRDYGFVTWFEKGYQYYLENPEPVRGQLSQCNIPSYVILIGLPAKPGEIEALINILAGAVPYASGSLNGYLYGTDTLARAELAYYQGNLIRAEQFARRAVFQGREKNQYEVENRALFYLMRIGIHHGDIAGIRELEKQIEAQLENSEYLNRYTIHDIIIGRFYARLGLTEKIAPWLRNENEEGEINTLFRGFDSLVKARCLYGEKDYRKALRTLEDEKARGELGGFLLGFLEMTALEAIIRYKLGDREGAFEALKQAYDAACPNALDMPFIELGEHMFSLVNALLKTRTEENGDPQGEGAENGIPREWLHSIRSNTSAYAKKLSLVASQYTDRDAGVSPAFSEHELAILNSLSQGRTSEEIAAGMNISVKVVQSVVRTLYTKLGAVNRADAIRIATQKGLFQDG
ncbi:MAG: LuxR C-terminal-related transcriptional regulator [Spirochaetaceae bacterium]|jgi:LuxR family maltose regulon positive regulatory protein|nr:LuxR C-terminal-related transcriptional regulator [Spirochaetaceae bacterium]